MPVLKSIRPRHVANIYAGTKQCELMRLAPNDEHEKYCIYECGTGTVTGEFTRTQINTFKHATQLRSVTKGIDGVTDNEFYEYFEGSKWCSSVHFNGVIKYDNPKPLSDFMLISSGKPVTRAPQSFCYVKTLLC